MRVKNPRIKVQIADRQTLFAEGMVSALLQESDIKVVGVTQNIKDCLKKLEKSQPDVVLSKFENTML